MRARRLFAVSCAVVLAAAWAGCSEGSSVSARRATNRAQLVGGERALGDVGDYVLENERIRVVVQGPGYSRGFGVYGGSLIDADRRRPSEQGTSGQASGNDQFGELFPAFFVQAVNVDHVAVIKDGSDGQMASVLASGDAGDFLELAAILNRAVTGSNADFQSLTSAPQIHYETRYELEPQHPWIRIRFKVENITDHRLKMPSELSSQLLGLTGLQTEGFRVPVGDIALFGATSKVWIPGLGYDSRFGLEDAYARPTEFPAFPGVTAEFVASHGNGASYGLAVAPSERNFVLGHKDQYAANSSPIDETTLLVPFSASSFIGIFHDTAPPYLEAGDSFEATKYFLIGTGDVASVLDAFYELRGTPTGGFGGQVFDSTTGQPALGTSVLIYQKTDKGRRIFSQADVRENGSFGGRLAAGNYSIRVQAPGRPLTPFYDFTLQAGETAAVNIPSTPPGTITVRVVDETGQALPAKATAIGIYGAEHAGELTRRFLYDLEAGESFCGTDLVDDDPDDPETRKYVETIGFTKDGLVTLNVRPGHYRIVSTRGPEYDMASTEVDVGPDENRWLTHKLTRVVDTRGWIAGDMHVHSRNSIDSNMSLDERVLALAGEGLDWGVATDHNFVTDYAPYIARNNLLQWLHPMVGIEMTTLESGHFNGYPLRYDPGSITHGAFAWAGRPPGDIFSDLRALGSLGPEATIVQANHPRDGVLGYFAQYNRSPYFVGETDPTLIKEIINPTGPAFRTADGQSAFSLGFDAIEVANGKLFFQLHHYRVPSVLPSGTLPSVIPETGRILMAPNGLPGFPGIIEDWFNLLNEGYRFIAVGTGDTHHGADEAGQFRTMVYVGDDRPEALTDAGIVTAMRSRRVVATNGPLIDFWVDDPIDGRMGRTIVAKGKDEVTLGYKLTSAPWASVARINVWRNGILAKVIEVDPDRNLAKDPVDETLQIELAKNAKGESIDSWFVLEAIGYKSFFPVVNPEEVPRVLLTEAITTLAGPLGLGGDEFGALRPPEWFPVTAFAISNPTWVTKEAGDFHPPGVVPLEILDRPENDPKMQAFVYPQSTVRAIGPRALVAQSRPIDRFEPRGRVPLFYPRKDNPFDVRKAFSRFGHLGGHAE